ncbi:MAG: hypothetical protein F4W89_16635 [Acidobacteria bacterium]|nr:hypothetical protein [Acidobacteriota bacterium]
MIVRPVRAAALTVVALTVSPGPADAQTNWLSGYLQTVPLFSSSTILADAAVSNFNRLRLTVEPSVGPFDLEVAYEHAATFRQSAGEASLGLGGLSGVPGGGEWFDLQRTVTGDPTERVHWLHRFDRLNVSWSPSSTVELSVGRQAVSWGTTLFLTPADPFVPFSPTDPFRVFRGGVDAARLRMYPGPLSEIDVVFRPTRTLAGEEVTLLARGLTTVLNWELSGWGGTLYGHAAGAVGLAGGLGAWAVRAEGVVRDYDGTVVGRGTVGIDRNWVVSGRNLGIVMEYQRDGRAAATPDRFEPILESNEFARGEYQVFGRDEMAMTITWEAHPLLSLSGLALWNLNDRSVIIAPGFSYSASDNTTFAGGVYVGRGATDAPEDQLLASEYGLVGVTGYLSLTWFF